MPARGLEPPTY